MLEGFKCRHLSFGSEGAVFTALEQVSKSSALSASLLGAHLGPRLTLEGWPLFPSRGQGLWIHPRLRRIWLGPGRKRPPRLRLLEKPTEDLKRANRQFCSSPALALFRASHCAAMRNQESGDGSLFCKSSQGPTTRCTLARAHLCRRLLFLPVACYPLAVTDLHTRAKPKRP